MKRHIALIMAVLGIAGMVMGCGLFKEASPLDPERPITVTVWHYYNSSIKEAFDALVTEFNETVELKEGIVIEAHSQGDVNQLATAVFEAANKRIGAPPMPDIFAAYADNAYRVHQITPLLPLNAHFSEAELAMYRLEFLEEGQMADGLYYIMPVAKSTENLYVIQNTWEAFAATSGYGISDLATWEGLYEVAKAYHDETGRGFFSLDANANFFITGAMQFGAMLYEETEAGMTFELPIEVAERIWLYYYRPYVYGYFQKTGRFSSDDAKTGRVIAYTGSTAGAAYFPSLVETPEGTTAEVDPLILPYPYFKDGKKVAIQQGAGMSIVKSDLAHEYGASVFLKWFTEPEQNLKFAVSTGYLPVQERALEKTKLLETASAYGIQTPSILASLEVTANMFESHSFYNNRPFEGSFDMRRLLDTHLFDKIQRDLEQLEESIAAGEDPVTLRASLTSREAFENWYEKLHEEAHFILKSKSN